MINSFKDLTAVIQGCKGDVATVDWHQYGQVNVQQKGGLILFSYTKECQFKKPEEWNWFEKVSRGLVMDIEGEIRARPFDKFWNYGEVIPTGEPVEITEKVDGSLGIMFWHNCAWRIVTRGSFDSEQAQWASKFLYENYDLRGLDHNLTLLLEIVYPENQIVIDYKGREDLVLLGVRNRVGEGDWWLNSVRLLAMAFGFSTPAFYDVGVIDLLLEKAKQLGPEHEGWVVRYDDGTRVKVKGAAYLELHKWIGKFTAGNGEKTVGKAIANGTLSELSTACPKAIQKEFEGACEIVDKQIRDTWFEIHDLWRQAPDSSRKEFALWVQQQPKHLRSMLFLHYDGNLTNRNIAKIIYGV